MSAVRRAGDPRREERPVARSGCRTRLQAIGLRPISALVDMTNFFTYDRNRPLHVFDVGKLKGGLRCASARPGETLQALDEQDLRRWVPA